MVSRVTGICPPLATMTAKLRAKPSATTAMPGTRQLRASPMTTRRYVPMMIAGRLAVTKVQLRPTYPIATTCTARPATMSQIQRRRSSARAVSRPLRAQPIRTAGMTDSRRGRSIEPELRPAAGVAGHCRDDGQKCQHRAGDLEVNHLELAHWFPLLSKLGAA